jgi:heptose I phosphotransferase
MSVSLDIQKDYEVALRAAGLAALEDLFAWGDGDRLDKAGLEGWRQRWRMRLAGPAGGHLTLYLKRFERPPLRRQWERWRSGQLVRSTAGVEGRNARLLLAAGIRAVEAAAIGEEMSGPLEIRSCILLSEAPGESLEKWLPAHLPPPDRDPDPRQRRTRLDAFARFVAGFHAAGFVHRDLYLCHIFHDGEEAARGRWDRAFCLIDLQRVFRPRWRCRRWVVKDLAALDFSAPADRVSRWERLRFLCRYTKMCGRFGSARTLVRRIGSKTARMASRQGRIRAGRGGE